MLNDVQQFYAGLRMAVMSRQQGMTWEAVGKMNVVEFFHVLRISEKNSGSGDNEGLKQLSRASKRPDKKP